MKDDKPQAKGEPKTGSAKDTLTSHPVGTAAGAAGGAAAGAVAGMAAGPVGSLVGAVAGAVGGAALGGGGGQATNPTPTEGDDDYWRQHYASRPYARPDAPYEDYAPAYRYGAQAHGQHRGRRWEEVEPELRSGWGGARGDSSLEWDDARDASRDAWDRLNDDIERMIPGDSDGDGR